MRAWIPLVVGLVMPACAGAGTDRRSVTPAPRSASVPKMTLLAVSMPGPRRGRGAAVAALNRGCVTCHADVAAEWQGSPHQLADRNPAYQRALAREPLAFCRGCHAPEANPDEPAPEVLSTLGVGCVTCHLVGEAVLAVPRVGASDGAAPHAIVRDPRFAAPAACAECHEFAFPDSARAARGELMQSTVSEHQRSSFAQMSCAECHMPRAGSRRSHAFSQQRDPKVLAASIQVRARRLATGKVRLELTSRGVGHAFPTGDLFRRLGVFVEVVGGDPARAVGGDSARAVGATRYLTRHYRPLGAAGIPAPAVIDDRLGVDGQPRADVELDLGVAAARSPLVWRVAYQRVEHPAGASEENAVVESEVVLATGRLAPEPLAPPEVKR